MSTKPTTRFELQQAIQKPLAQLLALQVSKSLAASTLDAAAYLAFLRVMRCIHQAAEEAARQLLARSELGLWDERWARSTDLAADIARLEALGIRELESAAQIHALALGQELQALAAEGDTLALLGALYALRSAPLSARAPEPDAEQDPLGAILDAAVRGPADLASVVRGARLLLRGLTDSLSALSSEAAAPRITAAVLNPEAGGHAITQDPLELQAALRAGQLTWQRFPYFEWRFGARGRRFTASDSAWLVTLTKYDLASIQQQIDWLGTLLSARGMPRWLLEQHIQALFAELQRALPDRPGHYDGLLSAAQHLREGRCAQISEARFESLWSAFDAAVDPAWRARLPEAGALLVAAVADKRAGISRAVSSLEGWMTDPTRFPPAWIAAVRATLRDAAAG